MLRIEEIVERYSITNVATKDRTENPTSINTKITFIRKGDYGGRRKYFSRESSELFFEVSGQAFIALEYECDESWAKAIMR